MARELLDVLFAGIWQGAGIAITAAAILKLSGRCLNAATRCVILQAAVAAIALVPLVTTLPSVTTQTALQLLSRNVSAPSIAQTGGSATVGPRRIDVFLSDRAVLTLTEIWAAGVLVFALRIGASSLQLERLRRRSRLLAERDGVRIYESPDIEVPLATGCIEPIVVVPAVLAARAGAEFECIVLHELAHVRRGDAWANAWGRAVHACLFFNPAVLLLSRAIALEREVACDDWAVARSRDLTTYAASLASFALRRSNARPVGAFTTSGFGRSTLARIGRLEDVRRNGTITFSPVALGAFAIVLFNIAISLHAFAPAIAFASQVPLRDVAVSTGSCQSSKIRYVSGPAPHPLTHVPDGLRTLVRVRVSPSGKPQDVTLFETSGNVSFDRAVIDAAKMGNYSPQVQNCRPSAGTYLFEATTS